MLLFPICMLVPTLMSGTMTAPQEDAPDFASTGVGKTEQRNVELSMMYFSPSASMEDGIYYMARRGVDAVAYFGESEVYYVVGDTLLRLEFPGSVTVVPVGEEPMGSITNYVLGNDPSKWRTGLRDCAILRYVDIYPGIDLVYGFIDGNLKYEFVIAPHADPGLIQMSYPDADLIEVHDYLLTLSKNGFTVADTELKAFQEGPRGDSVECAFHSDDANTIVFCVGGYDTSCELTIDPIILSYATFLGGTLSDRGLAIAVEGGFAYVTGDTQSSSFPTVNAYDATYNTAGDCFVAKLAADGLSLMYSTFLGGTGTEIGFGIAVEDGFAYVTGYTSSSGFPTVNAYDSTFGGGTDCFVTKFAADGMTLIYSTFLGGTTNDAGYGIAVENSFVYVMGQTSSSNFPTLNAYDSTLGGAGDCFVTKFAADGLTLIYSTFLGGTSVSLEYGQGIAVENSLVYVTGYTTSSDFPTINAYDSTYNLGGDCFVTKLAANGSSLVYSTFLGGTSDEEGRMIAVEDGFAYVTGYTLSSGFPTVNAYDSTLNGTYDCFVTKFATDGLTLIYSTFLGGKDNDIGYGIAVQNGSAFVTGYTHSSDFPTVNAYDSSYNGGTYDCFVVRFATNGRSLVFSTFLGGANDDYGCKIALENGSIYVVGQTYSSDFPTVNAYDSTYNGGTYDCFVIFICEDGDMDGLNDWWEACYGTNPFCIDSDNDNFLDGYEVAYGSDPMDPMSYPAMPQAWYDAIYHDLDGNATLIQYLIEWSSGNATLLQTVMQQLGDNATLLEQVISWLDGNHTAIETLFTFVDGNATLLVRTVNAVNGNSSQLDLLAALVTHNTEALSSLNATHIGDIDQIRAIMDMLGVTVGDTDYDGLDDLDEIALGTDIQCIDTDCDNLNDAYEVKIGTDPTDDDSDNDTYLDGAEVLAGTDPLDALDYPGGTGTTTGRPMGIELIVIAGAAGCVGLVALLVTMKRRAGARSSS